MCKTRHELECMGFTKEYFEGFDASALVPDETPKNPYNFYGEYTKHYDWSNGFQRGIGTCQCK